MSDRFDVVVVGAGVAGLSAAFFGARYGLRTAIVDRIGLGGQLINAGVLDSYPGLPDAIGGADFVGRLSDQVLNLGVEPELGAATQLAFAGDLFQVHTEGRTLAARSVIMASGGTPIPLGVPGEQAFEGRGVSHCAVCDGAFFAGQDVIVVGGGDAAVESALYLAGQCRKVLLVHRREEFRAAATLLERLRATANVEVATGAHVESIEGDDAVRRVKLRAGTAGSEREASGVFVCIGLAPDTALLRGLAELDSTGRVVVDLDMRTSHQGLYAVGAIRGGSPDQAITAAGDGATAALAAHRWLRSRAV